MKCPYQTPPSAKSGKTQKLPRATKTNKSGLQIPMANVGKLEYNQFYLAENSVMISFQIHWILVHECFISSVSSSTFSQWSKKQCDREIVISGKRLFFAGSPSGNNLTPVGPCRYDSSLGNTIISVLYYNNIYFPPFEFMPLHLVILQSLTFLIHYFIFIQW